MQNEKEQPPGSAPGYASQSGRSRPDGTTSTLEEPIEKHGDSVTKESTTHR